MYFMCNMYSHILCIAYVVYTINLHTYNVCLHILYMICLMYHEFLTYIA